MGEESKKTIVNSWNEWDPLKRVIVGRATGTVVQAPEPNVYRDWPEYGFPAGTYGPLPKEMEDKANEQLDKFADIYGEAGDPGGPADADGLQPASTNAGLGAGVDVWVHATAGCATGDRQRDSRDDDVLPESVV